ncbi:hypothetical protein FisN_6Lh452 [Fistulifera solaris]|uniref:Uncharacterized protein n=1 Tax=Fistulifera solaris TaxID=1519565 RepID=A0A1Z5JTG3_FISSO|nr:hypothetical protein FisN_6Lh452 [Fistulifera solaris]|eukprot:GAX17152.1 hypothetical protein FisN_6Lh452 [Fistulifera solaris]
MRPESSYVDDWCIFEDDEPSWNDDSTSFGIDFVVAADPAASPRRRVRRASLASSLSHTPDVSDSAIGGGRSVKSEQVRPSKTSSRATRRLSLRGSSTQPSRPAPPRSPVKKNAHRRSSISHTNDKLCENMASCSLLDLMKVNHISVDTASSSSGSATPPPPPKTSNHSPRRRTVEEYNSAQSSPRRSSPRRTRRLVSMPKVGSANPGSQSNENACTRRMARRMSLQA